jgi:hypothetical protein
MVTRDLSPTGAGTCCQQASLAQLRQLHQKGQLEEGAAVYHQPLHLTRHLQHLQAAAVVLADEVRRDAKCTSAAWWRTGALLYSLPLLWLSELLCMPAASTPPALGPESGIIRLSPQACSCKAQWMAQWDPWEEEY